MEVYNLFVGMALKDGYIQVNFVKRVSRKEEGGLNIVQFRTEEAVLVTLSALRPKILEASTTKN